MTYYYGVEDSYGRIDYILLSPGIAREWVMGETYIPTIPNGASAQITGRWWQRMKRAINKSGLILFE